MAAVVRIRHWKMYCVRWLVQFNVAFERQTEWTSLFLKMRAKELSRSTRRGEHILVEDLLEHAYNTPLCCTNSFPLEIWIWIENKKPVIRKEVQSVARHQST